METATTVSSVTTLPFAGTGGTVLTHLRLRPRLTCTHTRTYAETCT